MLKYFYFVLISISLNVLSDIILYSPEINTNSNDERVIELKIKNANVKDSEIFINEYKDILARCLVIIVTTLDPDAIVFGGGISNEIDFLDQIKKKTSSFINEPHLKTVFLKPKYGDASGVRGAAILSRQSSI